MEAWYAHPNPSTSTKPSIPTGHYKKVYNPAGKVILQQWYSEVLKAPEENLYLKGGRTDLEYLKGGRTSQGKGKSKDIFEGKGKGKGKGKQCGHGKGKGK